MTGCGCKRPRRAGALCGCSSSSRSSRSAGALERAAAVCDRWSGLRPGDRVPCRSTAVGRTLDLRVPGQPRGPVKIEACAVPRASVRPSKRCAPAYLGVIGDGLFRGQVELVDGGKVRNAMRTPRPSHPGMLVEWIAGKIIAGPRQRMRSNVDEGADVLEGLDLPYPHRAGSSICCPTSTLSALVLGVEVREAYEVDGEMPRALCGRLERLAGHLRSKHRVEGLASAVGPEDFDAAFAIASAGHAYCAKYLSDWQESAEVAAAFRKVERKREKSRKASARRRASKAAKSENSRAVKALQRAARSSK